MKNIYTGEEVVMLKPFEEYLRIINIKLDNFYNYIKEKDEECLRDLLKPLFHYGMISILVPLNEFSHSLLDEDQFEWWTTTIKQFNNYHIIFSHAEAFHNSAYKSNRVFKNIPYAWSFSTSYASMQEMLWKAYKDYVNDYIIRDNSLIGLIIPKFYCNRLESDFLHFLDLHILPSLISDLDGDANFSKKLSQNEKAVIKILLRIISQELGWRYYSELSNKTRSVLQYKEDDFYKLRNNEYRLLLFPNDGRSQIDGYVTVTWAESIDRINNYVNLLSISGFSTNILKHIAPILYQCAGLNEKATDLLLNLLRSSDEYISKSDIVLIALYRAVAIERSDTRSKLYENMMTVWGTNDIPSDLLMAIRSIVCFCNQISDEIPQRFSEAGVNKLISTSDRFDKLFYTDYMYSLSNQNVYDNINNLRLLSPILFENRLVAYSMEILEAKINDQKLTYSDRIECIFIFYKIFSMLTYKYDTEPRIIPKRCLELLGIDSPVDSFKDEIFEAYTYSQRAQLLSLHNQFLKVAGNIPYFSIVRVFESLSFDNTNDSFKENVMGAINSHEKILRRLQQEIKDYGIVLGYFLEFAKDDDSFNTMMTNIFIRNPELTREFCNELYLIYDNSPKDNISREKAENLKSLGDLLEAAISHPDYYNNRITKEHFMNAFEYIISCVPVASQALYTTKAIRSLKKGIDNLEDRRGS